MLNTAIALFPVLVILLLRGLFRLATLPIRLVFGLLLSLRPSRRVRA